MFHPALALQRDQFPGRHQRSPPLVVARRRRKEARGAHQRQHGFAAPAAAKPSFDTHVFHGADRQPRLAVGPFCKVKIEYDLREQRTRAVVHQRVDQPVAAVNREHAAHDVAHGRRKARMGAQRRDRGNRGA
jgi:hypothetical protein